MAVALDIDPPNQTILLFFRTPFLVCSKGKRERGDLTTFSTITKPKKKFNMLC